MTIDFEQIQMATQSAKRNAIGYTIGFFVGLAITIVTLTSPTAFAIITWGAIIFCPIYAIKHFSRYRKLMNMARS